MTYIHPVHEDLFHRIWLIAGPAPFVSGMITDSDSAKYIGGKLNTLCRDMQYLENVDVIYTSNRVKIYRLTRNVVEWCEKKFGPAHPLAFAYSKIYLESYQKRASLERKSVRKRKCLVV